MPNPTVRLMKESRSTSYSVNTKVVANRAVPGQHRVLLLTVARSDALFCIRLADLSEVGRLTGLTQMRGVHDAVLGSMVLHGNSVLVIDVAAAIGATHEANTNPKMFAATRTKPVICIALDEIIGKHVDDEKNTHTHPQDLVDKLVAIAGRSVPLTNVDALSRLVEGLARPCRDADAESGIQQEERC